ICAVKGSTVTIGCSYSYPWGAKTIQKIWFTKGSNTEPVDLLRDRDYNNRVKYSYPNEDCTLTITNVKESDSAEYKFRFVTDRQDGRYTGSPGVTLSVTDAPKGVLVSKNTSDEIREGSPVTLTCSSDANPAPNYTISRRNVNLSLESVHQGPDLVFRSIQSSDSGEYYCVAENELGRATKLSLSPPDPPRIPSMSVSPSGHIVEGSSVTLTCSGDANPAARYTWYKEDEDSPVVSGQVHTIAEFGQEHSGNYYCEAENSRGHNRSVSHQVVLASKSCFSAAITKLNDFSGKHDIYLSFTCLTVTVQGQGSQMFSAKDQKHKSGVRIMNGYRSIFLLILHSFLSLFCVIFILFHLVCCFMPF
uniref:Ig-like domain-containing protein n=1 Tax=Sphaeramia orbicularis TaxID=375764 RepID=A0A672ZY23_9TELE